MMIRGTIALGALLVALGACQTQPTQPVATGTATSDQRGIDVPAGAQAGTVEQDPVGGAIGGPAAGPAQPPGADDDETQAGTGAQDPVGGAIGGPGSGAASPGGPAQ